MIIPSYRFTGLPGLRSNYYENPSKVKFTGLLGLHVIDDNLFQLPVISKQVYLVYILIITKIP